MGLFHASMCVCERELGPQTAVLKLQREPKVTWRTVCYAGIEHLGRLHAWQVPYWYSVSTLWLLLLVWPHGSQGHVAHWQATDRLLSPSECLRAFNFFQS